MTSESGQTQTITDGMNAALSRRKPQLDTSMAWHGLCRQPFGVPCKRQQSYRFVASKRLAWTSFSIGNGTSTTPAYIQRVTITSRNSFETIQKGKKQHQLSII